MSELFSHSRLRCFENCPRQFHFRYVLKIPQETEGIEAFVGKRVHEVLERLYVFVGRGMLPTLPQVKRRFEELWESGYDPERVQVVREGTSPDSYRQLGLQCLESYYRGHYPFDADQTLGVEEHVVFDLDPDARPGLYRMQGIIDRISRTPDGTLEIHDYKTGRYVPSQKALDGDRQLALYQIGVGDRYGADRPVRLVWHYVARGTIRRSTRTPEQLDALRQETAAVIDRIREEECFPAKKSPLCDWCEYRTRCPAWSPGAEPPPRQQPRAEPRQPAGGAPRQLTLL